MERIALIRTGRRLHRLKASPYLGDGYVLFRYTMLTVALLAFVPGVAAAQTPAPSPALDPAAQQERLLKDLQYYRQRGDQPEAGKQAPVIRGTLPAGGNLPDSGVTFRLNAIRFNESAFISGDTLQDIAKDYVGKTVTFADINAMLARINALYAARGIVTAQALVPPQTIDGGVLRVRLVEGRLGELTIEGNRAVDDGFFAYMLPLRSAAVVNVPELRHALLLMNRSTGLSVGASIQAGDDPGESDIVLQVDEPARLQAEVFADNNGTETTGEYRAGLTLQLYSPLGATDRLTLFAVKSEGSDSGLIDYNVPVNRYGGRMYLRYSKGDIDIVNGQFRTLGIAGDSEQWSLGVDQPLYWSGSFSLSGYARASLIESETTITGVPLSRFDIKRYDLGLNVTGSDARYRWSLRQGVSFAQVDSILATNEEFWIANGGGSFSYLLTDRVIAVLRGAWQYAGEPNVPSTLLFQAGGVSSVRGYPEGVLAASSGYFISEEFRYRVNDYFTPFVFADQALVDGDNTDREVISSIGAGLRWQLGAHLSGEIAWGYALDDIVPSQDSGDLYARISAHW